MVKTRRDPRRQAHFDLWALAFCVWVGFSSVSLSLSLGTSWEKKKGKKLKKRPVLWWKRRWLFAYAARAQPQDLKFFFFCFQVVKLLSWSCCYYGCCKWPSLGPFSFFICVLLKYQSDTARHGHEQQLSTAPRKMIFLSFSTCWWPAPWIFPGEHLRPSWSAGNKKQQIISSAPIPDECPVNEIAIKFWVSTRICEEWEKERKNWMSFFLRHSGIKFPYRLQGPTWSDGGQRHFIGNKKTHKSIKYWRVDVNQLFPDKMIVKWLKSFDEWTWN